MMQKTKTETSAGGVVVRCTPEGPSFLVILDSYKNWGFPKGHVDPGETMEQAALREIVEETGLSDLRLESDLGVIDWFFQAHGETIHKYCHFFLFESRTGDPVPQQEEGITDYRWYSYADAILNMRYENAKGILRTAEKAAHDLCR